MNLIKGSFMVQKSCEISCHTHIKRVFWNIATITTNLLFRTSLGSTHLFYVCCCIPFIDLWIHPYPDLCRNIVSIVEYVRIETKTRFLQEQYRWAQNWHSSNLEYVSVFDHPFVGCKKQVSYHSTPICLSENTNIYCIYVSAYMSKCSCCHRQGFHRFTWHRLTFACEAFSVMGCFCRIYVMFVPHAESGESGHFDTYFFGVRIQRGVFLRGIHVMESCEYRSPVFGLCLCFALSFSSNASMETFSVSYLFIRPVLFILWF